MPKALRIVAVFDLTREDGPDVDESDVLDAFRDDELPALTGVYIDETHYEVEVVVADVAPLDYTPNLPA
jgi:hypothetical protein